MEMEIYIIAQIIGIVAWLFFLMSYFCKRINKIIFLQFISSVFYCINYLLLGAWSGLFVSMFEGIKELGYYKTDKDKCIFLITIPIYVLIAFISEKSILMIIPIIASIIDGYGILKNRNTVVMCGIVSNVLWIIYDLYYLNYAIAFSDFTIAFFNFCILNYNYSKFLRRNNVYTVNRKNISMSTLKKIFRSSKYLYNKSKKNLEKNITNNSQFR